MKKKNLTPFNVIIYDVNRKAFVAYDVMPYLVGCYEDDKKGKKTLPKTIDEFKRFVEGYSMYMYWGRCEWEIVLKDWPCGNVEKKTDVHGQITMNIEVITRILIENLGVTL